MYNLSWYRHVDRDFVPPNTSITGLATAVVLSVFEGFGTSGSGASELLKLELLLQPGLLILK